MWHNLWGGYRDELIATALVLSLGVFGTFFLTAAMLRDPEVEAAKAAASKKPETEAQAALRELGEVLGQGTQNNQPVERPTPTRSLVLTPTPTIGPYDTEVIYGSGGQYLNGSYELLIQNPKISFDARNSVSRKFVVEMVIRNISVEAGITNRLTASIVKDGIMIVPKAAMSVSESKLIRPGEQLTFEARISLIDGTDVKELFFEPDQVGEWVTHQLQ